MSRSFPLGRMLAVLGLVAGLLLLLGSAGAEPCHGAHAAAGSAARDPGAPAEAAARAGLEPAAAMAAGCGHAAGAGPAPGACPGGCPLAHCQAVLPVAPDAGSGPRPAGRLRPRSGRLRRPPPGGGPWRPPPANVRG